MATEAAIEAAAQRRAVGRYLRFLALAAGAVALLTAVGWLPTRNLVGEGAGAALVAAGLVGWLASALGGVPVLLAETAGAGRPPAVAFGSMLVRLLVVLGLALAVALSGLVPAVPFLVWTGIGYLALLVVDTRYLLATDPRPAAGHGGADEREGGREAAEVANEGTDEGTTERS